jgi:dihydrofolate synthase/folylpolyglutamate synthase
MRLDLEPMRCALRGLAPPVPARRVALIAGTNGKGSTATALNAIAMHSGLRVGLYTSPHLVDPRERVRINGLPLSRSEADVAARTTDELLGRTDVELTYFEFMTLVAWRAFSEADLDLAVFEVGLGGRLDATNTTTPDVSVVTSVSMDHEGLLGDTLAAIAREKAGIVRPGLPVVVHRHSGGFSEVARAVQLAAGMLDVVDEGRDAPAWNRALAVRAFQRLFPEYQDLAPLNDGAARARWPGRQQRTALDARRTLLLDGAHNAASAQQCSDWLASNVSNTSGRLPVIIGVSGGRDAALLAAPLASRSEPFICVRPTAPTGTPAKETAARIRETGHRAMVAADIKSALDHAFAISDEVLVTGSLYLIGDTLETLGFTAEDLPVFH